MRAEQRTEVVILADSVNTAGDRLTTMRLRYPLAIHAEFMTHRVFCLAGDALLEFDLPAGSHTGGRRVYRLPLAEFVDKWHNGSSVHLSRWGTERRFSLKNRLGRMQIRNVNESDLSPSFSNVVDCCVSGVKAVYEVTAGKYKVAGSADHRILTETGWRKIRELRVGVDSVATYGRGKRVADRKDYMRLKKINGRWVVGWNRKVFAGVVERQGGVCLDCGGVPTDVHHVESVLDNPERAFDESNVVAVCMTCHKKRHAVQGWQEGVPACVKFVPVEDVRFRGNEQTYDLEIAGDYPNFVANGVVVHNSRNARSRRAMKAERFATECDWVPDFYSEADPGASKMHGGNAALETNRIQHLWDHLLSQACDGARRLLGEGTHRFFANCILSPFAWTDVVVSSTKWRNFFAQRCHHAAELHMQVLAHKMRKELERSVPVLRKNSWHLPMVTAEERRWRERGQIVSAARCGRVSYGPDMVRPWEEDLKLGDFLLTNGHWSPHEHPAVPAPGEVCANYVGWRSSREMLQPAEVPEKYDGPVLAEEIEN